jgi:3-methyladenine DNA glycosylase/8-oxoguanine DNA glycosylase
MAIKTLLTNLGARERSRDREKLMTAFDPFRTLAPHLLWHTKSAGSFPTRAFYNQPV